VRKTLISVAYSLWNHNLAVQIAAESGKNRNTGARKMEGLPPLRPERAWKWPSWIDRPDLIKNPVCIELAEITGHNTLDTRNPVSGRTSEGDLKGFERQQAPPVTQRGLLGERKVV
jgi:hypothetical protein